MWQHLEGELETCRLRRRKYVRTRRGKVAEFARSSTPGHSPAKQVPELHAASSSFRWRKKQLGIHLSITDCDKEHTDRLWSPFLRYRPRRACRVQEESMADNSLYEALGVSRHASENEIKKVWTLFVFLATQIILTSWVKFVGMCDSVSIRMYLQP